MKECPNCHEQMAEGVKFCTHCGTNLQDVPTIAEVQRQQKEAQKKAEAEAKQKEREQKKAEAAAAKAQKKAEKAAKKAEQKSNGNSDGLAGYFAWLKQSFKNPSCYVKPDFVGVGYINLILEAIIFGLLVDLEYNKLTNWMNYLPGIFKDTFSINITNVIFQVIVLVLISALLMCLTGFLIKNNFYHDHSSDFNDFTNQIAYRSNVILLINLLGVLCLAINLFNANMIFMLVMALDIVVWISSMVMAMKDTQVADNRLDLYWGILIQGLIMVVIAVICYHYLVHSVIAKSFQDVMHHLGSKFFSDLLNN